MSSRSAAGAQRSARQPQPPQPQPLPPPLATAALLAPACRAPQSDSRRAPTQPTDPRTQPRSHQPPPPRPPHLSPTGGIHGAREPSPTIPEQCESTLESIHLAQCAGAAGEGGGHLKKARFGLGMPPACRAPQSDGLRAPTQPTDPPPPPPRPPYLSPTGGIHGAREPSPAFPERGALSGPLCLSGGNIGVHLGHFRCHCGATLGRLGAILEPCWADLEPSLADLGLFKS